VAILKIVCILSEVGDKCGAATYEAHTITEQSKH